MKRISHHFRYLLWGMALTCILFLAGCGGRQEETAGGEPEPEEEWVYRRRVLLEDLDGYRNLCLTEDGICFTMIGEDGCERVYRRRAEAGAEAEEATAEPPASAADGSSVSGLLAVPEGDFFLIVARQNDSSETDAYFLYDLVKYNATGEREYMRELSGTEGFAEQGRFIRDFEADAEGRVYISDGESLYLWKENGDYAGRIVPEGWIYAISRGRDGAVYLLGKTSGDTGALFLAKVDFDGLALGEEYGNVPGAQAEHLVPGRESDFLLDDGKKVYAYDLGGESGRELFAWQDCNVNAASVALLADAGNGGLMLWNHYGEEDCLSVMEKVRPEDIPEVQTLVLGTLRAGDDLWADVARFNGRSAEYRIEVKEYYEAPGPGVTDTALLEEAALRLNNDIIAGKGPDILDLGGGESFIYGIPAGLDVYDYAGKGLLEDLTPYLERSDKVSKEDFLGSVVEAYTIDGRLTAIPMEFSVSLLEGLASKLGEERSWSFAEANAFLEENGDALAFRYMDRETFLQLLFRCNESFFIDHADRTAHFDTEEFRQMVALAEKFPEDWFSESREILSDNPIAEGEVLLEALDLDSLQYYNQVKYQNGDGQETVFRGFPTADGKSGVVLTPLGSCYAIMSGSGQKDGAWEFVEEELTSASARRFDAFSSHWETLEKAFAEDLENTYEKDAAGEIRLDENGEPVRREQCVASGVTIYMPGQQEADELAELIGLAEPVPMRVDQELWTILYEELQPYFAGDKTLDEAVDVIQSRAQLLLSENL